MTKGRAVLPGTVAQQDPFFITLGGPQAHDSSVENYFHERSAEPQISPLRSPDFLSRFVALINIMRFLEENRIRGRCRSAK